VWQYLPKASREAVELAEKMADGLVLAPLQYQDILCDAIEVASSSAESDEPWVANATDMAYKCALNDGWYAVDWTVGYGPDGEKEAAVVRDIAGNGQRTIDPAWRTAGVLALAQAAYHERKENGVLANERLAALADALEEAGCQDTAILGHLRSGGEHWRGCWAVDLVLGKN
jgi:hypothetical protein